MKKLLLLLAVLLTVSALAFANPFLGNWHDERSTLVASVLPDSVLVVTNPEGIAVASPFPYFCGDNGTLTVGDTAWSYFVFDEDHIGLVGWIYGQPALVLLTRDIPEPAPGT